MEIDYTDREKIDMNAYNLPYLILICSTATICGFCFGYDTSNISGALLYLPLDFPEVTTSNKESINNLNVSIAMAGCAFGSIAAGIFSDEYGRKPTILLGDIFLTGGGQSPWDLHPQSIF